MSTSIVALSQNLLADVVGLTITKMLTDRGAAKSRIGGQPAEAARLNGAAVPAQPFLLGRFEERMRDLRSALDDPSIHIEAVDLIQALLESLTVQPDRPADPPADVAAETA